MRAQEYESPNPKVRVFLRMVDQFGRFAIRPFKRRRPGNLAVAAGFKKILLVRCDGLGDLVFSTPAITAVRTRYPDARLDLVVGPWSRDIAAMIPGINNVILHAPWGYRKLRSVQERTSLWEDLRFARQIRREHYDIAVDLRGDLLSVVPMWLWGIPVRLARATRGGGFALTHVVPPAAAGREHEVERTLDVVAAFGAISNEETPQLHVSSAAQDSARVSFAMRGIDISTSILMLPGAQWLWRQWPSENFRKLGRLLLAQGHRVVVVGAKTDEIILDAAIKDVPGIFKMAGDLNLQQLAGALALCRGFVACESGPAAIASGVGARGVVLFGPGVPAQFGPRAKNIQIVHEPCGDQPCYQRGDCQRKETWCMARLTVDRVFRALDEVLKRTD